MVAWWATLCERDCSHWMVMSVIMGSDVWYGALNSMIITKHYSQYYIQESNDYWVSMVSLYIFQKHHGHIQDKNWIQYLVSSRVCQIWGGYMFSPILSWPFTIVFLVFCSKGILQDTTRIKNVWVSDGSRVLQRLVEWSALCSQPVSSWLFSLCSTCRSWTFSKQTMVQDFVTGVTRERGGWFALQSTVSSSSEKWKASYQYECKDIHNFLKTILLFK